MRNDAHQPVALGQPGQGFHGQLQRIFTQRAKALIHEQSVHPDTACRCLYFIGKPQCQRQRRQKGFSAGQGIGAALAAVVMIDDVQIQAALGFSIAGEFPPFQLILSIGHDHEPDVGPVQDAVKIGGLDVCFQCDLFFAADGAAGGLIQCFHPLIAVLRRRQRLGLLGKIVPHGPMVVLIHSKLPLFFRKLASFLLCSFLLCL